MEFVVALAVAALLAGALTPMVGSVAESGRQAKAAADCRAIADAIRAYRADHGEYPPGTVEGDVQYGNVFWTERGGVETAKNTGKKPYREILVELKE